MPGDPFKTLRRHGDMRYSIIERVRMWEMRNPLGSATRIDRRPRGLTPIPFSEALRARAQTGSHVPMEPYSKTELKLVAFQWPARRRCTAMISI